MRKKREEEFDFAFEFIQSLLGHCVGHGVFKTNHIPGFLRHC